MKTDSLEFVVLDIDEKETLQLRSGCDASVHSVCQYHWHKYFEIYIYKQRICLDPFGKHKKIVTKGLRVITLEVARLHHELNLIPGKKLCPTCRREVSKHHSVLAVAPQHMSGESSSSEGFVYYFLINLSLLTAKIHMSEPRKSYLCQGQSYTTKYRI